MEEGRSWEFRSIRPALAFSPPGCAPPVLSALVLSRRVFWTRVRPRTHERRIAAATRSPETLCPGKHTVSETPSASAPAVDPVRVLIADDSADLRDLLRDQLSTNPRYLVVGEAADGQEAVGQAAFLRPDLVLLDLAMPHLDGLQALPEILAVTPTTRVVVFSGFNESTARERALAAGAHAYVVKGLKLRLLLDRITSAT